MNKLLQVLTTGLIVSASASAFAKLAPLGDEAKAKAAETAAKAAHAAKQETYLLCKSQDKVAVSYYAHAKTLGKETKPPANTAECADAGPFAYTPPEAKPLEASGAHSPTGNAISPPSTKQPDAQGNPAKK